MAVKETVRRNTILGYALDTILSHGVFRRDKQNGRWVGTDGAIVLRGHHATAITDLWPSQVQIGPAAVARRFEIVD